MPVTIICWAIREFISQICPPKWAWKSAFYRNNWSAVKCERRLWRHWKLPGMKVLIKHFKESSLAPETMLRTQRSRPFPKLENWLIFGILLIEEPYEKFLESFNFTNGWKWPILCKMRRWWRRCNGKVAVTFICWAMSIFISKVCTPKWTRKSAYLPQQLECRCRPTATVTSLKVTWNGDPDQALQGKRLCSRNLLCTQRSHPFLNAEKWFIFVIFFKGGLHENTLESFNFTNGWKWHVLCEVRRWWGWCNGKVAVTIICWAMSIFSP